MNKIKQFALFAAGALVLASCGSKMSEEEIAKKVDEQFAAQEAQLAAQAETVCNETFAARVTAKIAELQAAPSDTTIIQSGK